MYYYGYDSTYYVLVLPFLLLSLWASYHVKHTFRKYSSQISQRCISGAEAARRVLAANGIRNVSIEHISGELTDHFDPGANTLRLSDNVYDNCSTAAIGVACHEAGHAIQHALGYAPLRIRSAVIPITNLGSRLAVPLIMIGLVLSSLGRVSEIFVTAGILFFSFSVLFQLLTLPVEFDASRRALQAIEECGILTSDESKGASRTLRAAALTYVAATAAALAQLLRLLLLFSGSRNRRKD